VGLLVRPDPSRSTVLAAVVIEIADDAGPLVSVLPVAPPPVGAGSVRTALGDPGLGLG
jgi:hypothetical protein